MDLVPCACGLIEDDDDLLEVFVGGESGVEDVAGGVPVEAANEELVLGHVRVRNGVHDDRDVEVASHRVLEDVEVKRLMRL